MDHSSSVQIGLGSSNFELPKVSDQVEFWVVRFYLCQISYHLGSNSIQFDFLKKSNQIGFWSDGLGEFIKSGQIFFISSDYRIVSDQIRFGFFINADSCWKIRRFVSSNLSDFCCEKLLKTYRVIVKYMLHNSTFYDTSMNRRIFQHKIIPSMALLGIIQKKINTWKTGIG